MKTCKQCGQMLPDGANFCPFCGITQSEPEPLVVAKPWKRKVMLSLLLILFVAAAVLLPRLIPHHKIYESPGAEIIYSDSESSYRIFLNWQYSLGLKQEAMEELGAQLSSGDESAQPSLLFVFDQNTGELVTDSFFEKIQQAEVSAMPADGGRAMGVFGPSRNDNFPEAALAADIVYNAFSGTNDIVWKLDMKNGDRIILRHRFNVSFLDSVVITAADVPLDTMEDLRSFLQQASEKYTSAAVTIYLPAVTYEGDLDLSSRGFEFIGSTENGRQTSFRGHIRVSDRTLQIPTFRNIAFPGSGGTGIAAATALELHQCAFTGWDTGVLVENGGWVGLHECLFEANETGFLFDSISATMVDEIYDSNRFINNETAVSLLRVPGTVSLSFPKTLFSGNRVDLLNSCNAPVDMSDAIIK